ncbi:RNA polymerase factor sigma-54 [Paenibacillus swuensis]|uniref:RNA polymerase factor sigma-54 n=1 Tax=Paenibacillus swuensis TaxID=1178515 RepID=UPI0018D2BFCB|nr:RNA polymerase factor sigma-54 [Paenibacillus swuensis]
MNQEQTYKLALTPELRQSVQILQMSGYELTRYLEEETRDNPLLELEYRYERGKTVNRSSGQFSGEYDPFSRIQAAGETLEQQLIGQLNVLTLSVDVYDAAVFLAGSLGEQGYLETSLEEIALTTGYTIDLLKAALHQVQSFEPAGVAARNLAECLLLQVRRDADAHPLAEAVITSHLEGVAQGKLAVAAQALKVPVAMVSDALRYIRSLDPKPGTSCAPKQTHYIVPDAYIDAVEPGQYVIRMNERYMPKVTLSTFYQGVKWDLICKETSSFLKERERSADWLMRSLDHRKKTLVRVIETIVEEQMDFLRRGERYLKPMNLKVISERLNLHESTVSRAIAGKFVKLPAGIYELKYFFSSGLQTMSGEAASSRGIKSRIKLLVDQEDRRKPLSDQKIAELLQDEGVHIARRTVAKYREELRILPSSVRKSTE